MLDLICFLLIGLAAGWLSGRVVRGQNLDLARSLIVGILGALLGGFLFRLLGLSVVSLIGSLIMALSGAIVLLFLLQKFKL